MNNDDSFLEALQSIQKSTRDPSMWRQIPLENDLNFVNVPLIDALQTIRDTCNNPVLESDINALINDPPPVEGGKIVGWCSDSDLCDNCGGVLDDFGVCLDCGEDGVKHDEKDEWM